MPTFMFEAIDAATGKEIRDTVDATNENEAQATIRSMGYMVTKIKAQKKSASSAGGKKPGRDVRTWQGQAERADAVYATAIYSSGCGPSDSAKPEGAG